jgi:phosphoribosylamine---glycine ligase
VEAKAAFEAEGATMKVLVVGGGGREHALSWKIRQSPKAEKVFCAPGNAGIAAEAQCVPIAADDVAGLLAFAKKEGIGLTVVGPEAALTAGIVDLFAAAGLRAFGPSKAAAEIEGSKAVAKALMERHGVPTAPWGVFTDASAAKAYIRRQGGAPLVVKADGLAAGKGVLICPAAAEAEAAVDEVLTKRAFGDAGASCVVEGFLAGEEASFLAFSDGKTVLPLASCQDHKRVGDGDTGPNTGGMGAYSPAPVVDAAMEKKVMERVMLPIVRGMAAEGRPYVGVLYAGLMIDRGEPGVLEFNARFGDPETQPLLMRLDGDLVDIMERCIDGRLHEVALSWADDAAVCVVMASGGYPGSYGKGKAITGLAKAGAREGVKVFHAGTAEKDGRVVTAGGRVLGVTARGRDVAEAVARAYAACADIGWEGAHYRRDIAARALARLKGKGRR